MVDAYGHTASHSIAFYSFIRRHFGSIESHIGHKTLLDKWGRCLRRALEANTQTAGHSLLQLYSRYAWGTQNQGPGVAGAGRLGLGESRGLTRYSKILLCIALGTMYCGTRYCHSNLEQAYPVSLVCSPQFRLLALSPKCQQTPVLHPLHCSLQVPLTLSLFLLMRLLLL